MKYREIKVSIPKDFAEDFSALLDEWQVAGYYEILFDREEPRKPGEEIISDNTPIRVYLAEEDTVSEAKIWIYLQTVAPENSFAEARWIETKEYEEAYKEFYKPFSVGVFWVVPTWEKEDWEKNQVPEKKDSVPVYINPGLAFGTGHHETTRLVLSRLGSLGLEGKRVADIGAGSGILSVAAARLKASKIVAVDIDPNAVRSSVFNRDENKITEDLLQVEEGGFDHPLIREEEYDLCVANITFAVLKANMDKIAALKTKHYLFSGVITERKEEFLELLKTDVGGRLVYEDSRNGWELIEWTR
ncbi:methyltransferase domain-containing protein [Leptospira langatensis]|uniref:Ribosomal protein L11 methyltransferase n=1 Tax=Leptospira langatensis TaxID=2484983 RepID=A0A5F1ZYK3_9LEPT|nr:50S ribosomal protein L11 methyltransferase [Leptospira langatensis]TGJ98219.1 methyltransferase domain-containing protein [Leptospira langatensis]TGL43133.1 methyltransferase domain-containing protein [Leptospira langatensis]